MRQPTPHSASTSRWDALRSFLPLTLKRQCDTRWSARHDAVKAVHDHYDSIIECLEDLQSKDSSRNTTADAGTFLLSMQKYEFISLLKFWHPILTSVDRVTKGLQSPKLNINDAAMLAGLVNLLSSKADETIENAIDEASAYCDANAIPISKRVRRKKKMPGEEAEDSGLAAKAESRRMMVEIIDRLKCEINDRSGRLQNIHTRFAFLINLHDNKLENQSQKDQLMKNCIDLSQHYDEDIKAVDLYNELIDFILMSTKTSAMPSGLQEKLNVLMKYGIDAFPTAYRLLLTIAFSVASCERSFSKLKLIKTYLRSTMAHFGKLW